MGMLPYDVARYNGAMWVTAKIRDLESLLQWLGVTPQNY